MNPLLHDTFIDVFKEDIKEALDKFRKGPRRTIISTGTPHLLLKSRYGRDGKSPDACFWRKDVDDYGLIVEVAWSQSKEDLDKKAEQWIKRTNVQTVIAINLNGIHEN
jgi:hypothetical protein